MPKMTKAHFELLAETIANLPIGTPEDSETPTASGYIGDTELNGAATVNLATLIREIADMCASTNPAFSRDRFERACWTRNYRAPRNVTRY